jgi:winged helix DNA-binding protein
MNLNDIAQGRLISQQIAGTKFKTAKEIVGWMGAMQAQDYNMAKWAVGVRLPGSTDKMIEAALSNGEILRTHVLRPTWHFVLPGDIHWMLQLTAPRIKASMKSRHKALGLSAKVIAKSNSVIGKALEGGKHLTRDELTNELKNAKIKMEMHTKIHLLLMAELDGIVCSGCIKNKKQTYALLKDRVVQKNKILSREEAMTKLAQRYFASHGPATVQDFAWWSGLTAADAKHALEMAAPGFISEKINSQTYWFDKSISISGNPGPSAYLLPAYDEYLISYTDRSAALHKMSVPENVIFKPVIVVNGQVAGLWKRMLKKNKVIAENQFFKPPAKAVKSLVAKATESFSNFFMS